MGLTNFDELNTLSTTETTKDDRKKATRKKIPIHDYFENMQISEEEKEKRVRLANLLLADVLFLFALSKRNQDHHYLSETFQKRYLSSVKKVTEPDQKMQRYIRKVCDSIVDTTLKGQKGGLLADSKANQPRDPYAVSMDRATNVAENEANTILNGDEYNAAIKNGCTKKRWTSYKDERVRADHADVDGQVIDINRPFHVGEYMMMYPKDDSLGAGLEEIVNCRCSVEYLTDVLLTGEKNGFKMNLQLFSNGKDRADKYSSEWETANLDEIINKLVPNATASDITEKGKITYSSDESFYTIVYDINGNYFRIEDKRLTGQRRYVDLNGNNMSNITENGKTRGRTKSEYQRVTHFMNTEVK